MPDPHNQREPSPEERFAQLVREKREALGWSQEELARRVSEATGAAFHQTGITRIEKQARSVRLNEALVLARVLGIELGPLARNLDDDLQNEQSILRVLDLTRQVLAEQDSDVFKIQVEMERLTTRYESATKRLAETKLQIADLERALEATRRNIAANHPGERDVPTEPTDRVELSQLVADSDARRGGSRGNR